MARMLGRVSIGFAIAASAAALAGVAAPAQADEAYLCGPETIVYVAVADLELKKRTDPCIAAYYGLKVEQPAKVVALTAAPLAKTAAAQVAVQTATKPAVAPFAELKLLTDAEVPSRFSSKLERHASLEPARTAPGTDYRRVKILNAGSANDTWFHHAR